jgi:hypothetical protein
VNWPFEEYKLFKDYNDENSRNHKHHRIVFESRLIPVIAEDPVELKLPDEKLRHKDHRPWRPLFDKALYLELPATSGSWRT